MRENLFIILCALPCCFSCVEKYDTISGKGYEFIVENQISDKTVKIVPKSKTDFWDFWISSSESYVVASGQKVIIGSMVVYDKYKTAKDIYQHDDIIALFDVYIDEVKYEKELFLRKFWNFSLGKVSDSGKYTLIINENTLNE